MKCSMHTVFGAAVFYAVGHILLSVFANWCEPRYIKSDNDIGVAFAISLAILLTLAVIGGIVGNYVYRRRLNRKGLR